MRGLALVIGTCVSAHVFGGCFLVACMSGSRNMPVYCVLCHVLTLTLSPLLTHLLNRSWIHSLIYELMTCPNETSYALLHCCIPKHVFSKSESRINENKDIPSTRRMRLDTSHQLQMTQHLFCARLTWAGIVRENL